MVGVGVPVGEVFFFDTRRAVPREALSKMRRTELALSYIEEAVDHLTLLPPFISMSAGEWNVYSTRAQFALGRMLTAIEKVDPWINDAVGARMLPGHEWAEMLARVKKEGRIVAALASALCSNSMPSGDRCQTQNAIAAEMTHLIAELVRVQTLFQKSA
jgi:hypothetical protein